MKWFVALVSCLFVVVAASSAAEIVLVYPRVESGDAPFVYDNSLDSTFILGHVIPPAGRLTVNGQTVDCTAKGAFVAWLPLRRGEGQQSWDLSLRTSAGEETTTHFPYVFRSQVATPATADTFAPRLPVVVRVTAPNAKTQTDHHGTYHLFPQIGCRFLATGYRDGFFDLDLGGGLSGVIDRQFVSVERDSVLRPLVLGNGACDWREGEATCRFELAEPTAWTASLSEDGKALFVHLFNVRAACDRIRYSTGDPLLHDIVWEQTATGLTLELRCNARLSGYLVEQKSDGLTVILRGSARSASRTLRGKIIVLDPGHGGSADGAIGPLGTREKDVNLRLALLLAERLRKRGAVVRLTRETDSERDLYGRVDSARAWHADFLLSLHCNALPDGENPFVRHGSGSYYYHSASRRAAETLQRRLLQATGLQDDGIWDANLAVPRASFCPSVLVETAYLTHPREEELLTSDAFFKGVARALERGLDEYFGPER